MCEPYSPTDYITAMGQMILEGKASSVLYLIGLDPGLVNGKTIISNSSWTPLMAAVIKENNAEVINILMEKGANATIKNNQGDTPLIIACRRGYTKNVEALINAENDISLDERDNNSNTPLMIAASKNKAEIVDVLLNAGANADIGNASGKTALMLACKDGHSAPVDILLRKAKSSLDIQDNEGKPALMYALGQPRVFHQLLTAGANTDKVMQGFSIDRALARAYPIALQLLNEPDAIKRESILPPTIPPTILPTSRTLFDIARRTPGTLLGRGGAGAVRAVGNTAIKRVVFDKNYLYKNVDNVSPLDTYEDEIGTLTRLKGNPYVLQLIDSEKYNHNAYMITERLRGTNLRRAIFNKQINNKNVENVIEQLVTGMQSIHDAGILHLDIKPQNIWFTPGPFRLSDPRIKYLDFGDSCSEIPCIKDYSIRTEGYALKDRPINDGFYYDKSNDYYALAMTINELIPEEDRSPDNKKLFRTIISGLQSLPGV